MQSTLSSTIKTAYKRLLMREFPKPKVVVSKCVTFEPSRYNAQIIASEFVEKLKPYVTFLLVCPEVEIGLRAPWVQARIFAESDST